jgi:hypothetical protein
MIGNYIKAVAVAVSRSTAKLMKTGQTISYATNDDGDLEAGRNTSFTVLAENNPFGNTNRFTSTTGNQTYTNRITIDWSTYDGSTVLGWKMDQIPATAGLSWSQSITSATAAFGGFATGWRLPNVGEMFSIINFSTIGSLPNNIGGGQQLWTSTTVSNNTGTAYIFNGSFLLGRNKTDNSNLNHVAVRTFTVTGTTLS